MYRVHKMYSEYCEEVKGAKIPMEQIADWISLFSQEDFFCLHVSHGRKMVGLVTMRSRKYLDFSEAMIECFIIRREFRGDRRPMRLMLRAIKDFLKSKDLKVAAIMLPRGSRVLKRSKLVRFEK